MTKKTIKIEGMSCGHCKARVEKVLSERQEVTHVEVDLEQKCAVVHLSSELSNASLTDIIDEAGYDVISVE